MTDRDEARAAFTGAIPSISTPYTAEGRIDYDGLRAMIDFDIAAGAKAIVLTAGDSHYIAMSDRQIGEMTKATVEHVAGRALVVAADRNYDTPQALEFADYCSEVGADLLMLMPPDWAHSTTSDTLAGHYTTVAEHFPVMIVTNVFVPRGAAFGLEVLEKTLDRSNNVLAIKDDMCGDFARKMALLVHERVALWAGGQKQNHLNMAPYGGTGYLSTFLMFKPEIAHRYWKAWERGDLGDAVAVIRDYDFPFFQFIAGLPGGFDAGIHGVLECYGIGTRHRPKPYLSLGDEEMERVKDWLQSKGLL